MYKQIFALALLPALVACGSSSDSNIDTTPTPEVPESAAYITIDSTHNERVYLNMNSGSTFTESEKTGQELWHLSYKRYSGFALNGGIAGDGEVAGCTAHHYPQLYDDNGQPQPAEFETLNKDNTQTDFEAVTTESCDTLITDSLTTIINMDDWLQAAYGPSGPSFAAKDDTSNGWIIRSGDADGNGQHHYARVKVEEVGYDSGTTPTTRKLKLTRELWDSNSQSFGAQETSEWLDFSEQRVYWNMNTNSIVSSDQAWDLSIAVNGRSWDLQTNAGVSGPGNGGVGLVVLNGGEGSAWDVTNPGSPDQVYTLFTDAATGALTDPGNFGPLEYNVTGTHDMTANFTVYRIHDGLEDYRLQILSNYGEDDDQASGHIYLRYEKL
ncbi:hypothetical protein [Marinobacter salexigens]|uniref:Heme-binding HmuY-like protein n=1 Tax=Marinobacter salexigens TaxID=1925763 RepID=A0ABS6A715_9GAMM|nr:hypothetical protein [Marinobacter salexigens]MBU2873038.1 hypothetical protein [Marinobacter salexigens]